MTFSFSLFIRDLKADSWPVLRHWRMAHVKTHVSQATFSSLAILNNVSKHLLISLLVLHLLLLHAMSYCAPSFSKIFSFLFLSQGRLSTPEFMAVWYGWCRAELSEWWTIFMMSPHGAGLLVGKTRCHSMGPAIYLWLRPHRKLGWQDDSLFPFPHKERPNNLNASAAVPRPRGLIHRSQSGPRIFSGIPKGILEFSINICVVFLSEVERQPY